MPIDCLADDKKLGIMGKSLAPVTFEIIHLFVVVFCLQLVRLEAIPQSLQSVAWKGACRNRRNRLGVSFDTETIGSLLPLFKETKESVPLKWEQRGSEKQWLLFAKSCQAATTAGSLIYLVSRDTHRVKRS